MQQWRLRWATKSPTSVLSDQELRDALRVLQNYDSECLRRPQFLDDDLNFPGALDYVRARVGVVRFLGVPVCTGTWVGPRWVLTARHCLFFERTQPVRTFLLRAINNFSFSLDDPQARAVDITRVIDASFYAQKSTLYDPNEDLSDQVLLELSSEPIAGQYPGIQVGVAQVYDPVLLYAFQRNAGLIPVIEGRLRKPPARDDELDIAVTSWQQFIRFDAHETCRIAVIYHSGCLIHACQSEMQTSGAPIFRRDAHGQLALVGVHTRSMVQNDTGACAYSDHPGLPNVAVRLDPAFSRMIDSLPENASHIDFSTGGGNRR